VKAAIGRWRSSMCFSERSVTTRPTSPRCTCLLADAVAKQRPPPAIVAGATAAGEKGSDARAGPARRGARRRDDRGLPTVSRFAALQRGGDCDLVADAQDAANTARAAQARRDAAAPASDGRGVSLSTLTRAAQLGIVSTADYATALQARGYSDADIALELDLLRRKSPRRKRRAGRRQRGGDARERR
jgi:hypothetical protein